MNKREAQGRREEGTHVEALPLTSDRQMLQYKLRSFARLSCVVVEVFADQDPGRTMQSLYTFELVQTMAALSRVGCR